MRTAIVTGAAQGIGLAIARELHAQGHRVVLADIADATEQAAALGDDAWAARVDMRSREAVTQLVEDTVARAGAIDVLVNNAARIDPVSLWDVEPDDWDDVLAVNLRGPLFAMQAAGPHMRARTWGRIVNVSSIAGQQGGLVGGPHYSASKAALIVLTKIAARDLAAEGVTVNAVAPAAIESPTLESLAPERRESMRESIPVRRFGRAEEVAALVAFLASDAAGFITGATLDVNGGLFMR